MSDATSAQTRQELQRDLEQAKRTSAELAEVARERGREQLEGAKREMADRADRLADVVESTADQLEQTGGEAIAGYGRSLGTVMRQLAGGLRERDVDEFVRELSSFARQHPGAFLAGSVALGFGISRFFKASTQRSHDDRYYDDELSGDEYGDFDRGSEREYSGDPFVDAEAGDSAEAITGLGTESTPLGGSEPPPRSATQTLEAQRPGGAP
jgi:hypothetical protein